MNRIPFIINIFALAVAGVFLTNSPSMVTWHVMGIAILSLIMSIFTWLRLGRQHMRKEPALIPVLVGGVLPLLTLHIPTLMSTETQRMCLLLGIPLVVFVLCLGVLPEQRNEDGRRLDGTAIMCMVFLCFYGVKLMFAC